jgi:hypothetical protein
MAAVTPSGSSGGIVEITNTAVAPANQFSVVAISIIPGQRPSYAFPDGCTNITWRVRQLDTSVRFFSDIASTGYYTTTSYSSGSVNTKGVTFCWESDIPCDIEIAFWGPKGSLTYEAISKSASEVFILSESDINNKKITLTFTPDLSYTVSVTPRDGCTQFRGPDFNVIGSNISWANLTLDSLLEIGDILQVDYFY